MRRWIGIALGALGLMLLLLWTARGPVAPRVLSPPATATTATTATSTPTARPTPPARDSEAAAPRPGQPPVVPGAPVRLSADEDGLRQALQANRAGLQRCFDSHPGASTEEPLEVDITRDPAIEGQSRVTGATIAGASEALESCLHEQLSRVLFLAPGQGDSMRLRHPLP